ncbi:Fungal specific transcription factor domain-containing protein [Cladophialophora immunda]|nr:Fungal specific transcription factor domain-containing protein [Cladophialophora immunda]
MEFSIVAMEGNGETGAYRAHQDLGCYEHVPNSLHPYALFPVETDGRARQLIQFMHNEGDYLYRPFRHEWFAMAVIDNTAFYLSLANAALFFHQMTERKGCEYSDFEESSKYLSLCLNQVAQRLGRESHNISEGVITTVLGFLCHDSTVGKWDRYNVHMNGLNNIVRLRGGIQALNSNIVMFTCWFDILGASVFDRKPRFPLPPGFSAATFGNNLFSQSMQDLLVRVRNSPAGLADCAIALEKGAQLAAFVNENGGDPSFWKDGARAAKRITPVLHFVLSLRRLTDTDSPSDISSEAVLRELVRLALLILVASVKQAFSLIADELTILLQRFSALVSTAPFIGACFPELSLWAIIMVASLRLNQYNGLHAGATVNVMRAMRIKSGKAAVDVAKGLIWIDELMEMRAPNVIVAIDHASCLS